MSPTATGRAVTDRAARYLKQLASHLGKRIDVTFDEGRGATLAADYGSARLTVTAGSLEFEVEADSAEDLFRLMWVIQRHLEKFGDRDDLACEWDDAALAAPYAEYREEFRRQREAAAGEAPS